MRRQMAEQFLDNLETAFDYKLAPERRVYYVDALLDLPESVAQDAFNQLVFGSKRFPTVADVISAFEANSGSTRETSRSAPLSREARLRQEQALRRYLELEPVFYHPDLYAGYVQALREYREGRRSREELATVRQAVIQEALRRAEEAKARAAVSAQSQQAPQPDTGIAASLPRGDRE